MGSPNPIHTLYETSFTQRAVKTWGSHPQNTMRANVSHVTGLKYQVTIGHLQDGT